MILAHAEGEMGWLRTGGVVVYNHAFEVVILANGVAVAVSVVENVVARL